jgi:hypothetical protein
MLATRPTLRATIVVAALALSACAGDRLGGLPGTTAEAPPPARPSTPPVDMAGRWLLSQPGGGQCHMNFVSPSPAAVEGAIRPEGGCPGRMFMSRKWTFEQGQLTIRNHNNQPLAQLSAAGGGYEGKATGGEPLTLLR